nr:hypothetical protein [Frankia sp. AvcI1]
MCGITGWVSFGQDDYEQKTVIEAMTATLRRRGPDAGGTWVGAHAAIGHRRLAVIDLVGGVQPMVSDQDGAETVLTYSGEIYNHHELRGELVRRGHTLHTRSDTEVVLHAYLEWGDLLVDRLEGMYAFAVWDERAGRLLLVRDRLGVKPLFYAEIPGGVVFGSEPKALFCHPLVRPRGQRRRTAGGLQPVVQHRTDGVDGGSGAGARCPGHVRPARPDRTDLLGTGCRCDGCRLTPGGRRAGTRPSGARHRRPA